MRPIDALRDPRLRHRPIAVDPPQQSLRASDARGVLA
jgi:hypothetical protein